MRTTAAQLKAQDMELVTIRRTFNANRSLGLWSSPYPQSAYATLLGVFVREHIETDPSVPKVAVIGPLPAQHHEPGYSSGTHHVWSRAA